MKTFHYNGESARCTVGERELHCGDCFKLINGKTTHDVRIEHGGGGWYLVGVSPNRAEYWDGTAAEEYAR